MKNLRFFDDKKYEIGKIVTFNFRDRIILGLDFQFPIFQFLEHTTAETLVNFPAHPLQSIFNT